MRTHLSNIAQNATRVTIYTSSTSVELNAATRIHSSPRAGSSAAALARARVPGVDIIEVTSDLATLNMDVCAILRNEDIAERAGLILQRDGYWRLEPRRAQGR